MGAAFLVVWLCGWAVGEAFAIGMLARGLGAEFTRAVTGNHGEPAAVLAIGVFIAFWLALWTLGGVLALRDLGLRLWGEDRVTADGAGLAIERRRGPFRATRHVARSELRDVRLDSRGARLVAETMSGTVTISTLGMTDERTHVAEWLRREVGLERVAAGGASAVLPGGWQEFVTPEGVPVLIEDPVSRRRQAWFTAAAAVVFTAMSALVVTGAPSNPAVWPGVVMLAALAAGLSWGAWRLAFTRTEWRIGQGRIVQQHRSRSGVRDGFVAARLELTERRDSDGDSWVSLEAVAADAPADVPSASFAMARGASAGSRHRRRIVSRMNDPDTPRRLGAWLFARTEIPLTDLASPEARAAELAHLKQLLEQSGGLGRLASRLLDRVAVPPRS